MESIRIKDKIFLALVVPTALAAAYCYFWRTGAAKRIGELEREDAALVSVDDFPAERLRAEKTLKAARDELSAEGKIPMPATKVKARPDDAIASRERAVLEIFKLAGLAVERSDNAENVDSQVRDVLVRTGCRPSPVCRRYAIVGSYPQVCAALRIFADREMAVIPDRVEMPSHAHWSLALWL